MFIEGLMLKLKLQYFGHMMRRAYSLEKTLMLRRIEGKTRSERQRMRGFDAMHHQLNGHEFEHALGIGAGQGSLACWSPWGPKKSDMTVTELN